MYSGPFSVKYSTCLLCWIFYLHASKIALCSVNSWITWFIFFIKKFSSFTVDPHSMLNSGQQLPLWTFLYCKCCQPSVAFSTVDDVECWALFTVHYILFYDNHELRVGSGRVMCFWFICWFSAMSIICLVT